MGDLNNILEKVLTLNVNANTNINIQDIIIKYVLYTNIGKVLITFILSISAMIIIKMIIKTIIKAIQASYILKAEKKMEKKLENFDNWDDIENLTEKINKILEYMPRNKNKRKID